MSYAFAHPLDDPEYAALDRARENLLSDPRACEEFAARLLAEHHDTITELLTGAYGYGEQAVNRFRRLLDDCQSDLHKQAEHNLETRGF